MDPRTPVLVGCGQTLQRVDDPLQAREPLALMIDALERAADDCGQRAALGRADAIFVPRGLWRYSNPAALIAERLGVPDARTGLAAVSGSKVQQMVSAAALAIAEGRSELALIVGAECEHSKRRARRAEVGLDWTEQTDSTPDEDFGPDGQLLDRLELERGLRQPAAVFSLFDNAMRYARGESLEAHRARISRLWSGFSEVAARNPAAWSRVPLSPKEIGKPSASNRMVAPPYTKRLCSNMVVDQAAALILCSVAEADRLGIALDRRIFLHSATDVRKTPLLSHRMDLRSAPAIRHGGRRALALVGVGIDEVAHLDLYSCFPAAVALAMQELEVSEDRVPTVTGGLAYAGGPFNSYVLHAIATMMDVLRSDPTSRGLVTSIGGWLSKHAFGVYSAQPAKEGFRYVDCDLDEWAQPTRAFDAEAMGRAEIETYLVNYDYAAGAPTDATFSCLFEDGRRGWATSQDASLLQAIEREEFCGRRAQVRAGALLEID